MPRSDLTAGAHILTMGIYELLTFFIVYSFAGWVVEVIFHAAFHGHVVNRGFLNGPVCPVYGFGMTAVLFVFSKIGSDNLLVVIAVGIVLTTAIELLAGFILDKCFHARWWDYSDMPLNLNGYICPAFSLIWGMAVAFAVNIAHPYIVRITVDLIPEKTGLIIDCVITAVFIVDTILTALTLIGLNKKLRELNDISRALRSVSDKMSDSIGSNALTATQKAQTARIRYELGKAELQDKIDESVADMQAKRGELSGKIDTKRAELNERIDSTRAGFSELIDSTRTEIGECIDATRAGMASRRSELQSRYDELRKSLTVHRHFGAGRLLRVFPNVKHRDFKDLITEIQKKLDM